MSRIFAKFNGSMREMLYREGMRRALRFCKMNKIAYPVFMTLDELVAMQDGGGPRMPKHRRAFEFARRVMPGAALVGANTGLYRDGVVFVNLNVTALPVSVPVMRSWSWPCYKTDRTAMGVVAHETGHHVMEVLQKNGEFTTRVGERWRMLIERPYGFGRKQVSGYEPVASEAMAETLRLFILNPELLRLAIPARYSFVREFLKPSEKRDWRAVLGPAHDNYFTAAERWIGGKK